MKYFERIDPVKKDDNDFGLQSKCYEGILKSKKKTELGHLLLTLDQCMVVKTVHGVATTKKSTFNEMNFLVPKRRPRVFEYCEMLKFGCKVRIILLPESKSGKWTVSECELRQ